MLSLGPGVTSIVGAETVVRGSVELSSARAGTRFQLELSVEEPVQRNLRATSGTPDRPTWMDSSRREARPPSHWDTQ